MNADSVQRPIIVTGLSGAGLSSVLKALEDFGFEVFDNFPLHLVQPLLNDDPKQRRNVAIGIDTRTRDFEPKAVIETAQAIDAQIIFITCDDAVLYKRFTETRRRHPMAKGKPVSIGIEHERALLSPLQDKADLTIDSSHMSVHDLRHILEGHFGQRADNTLNISLMSFGFRNGLPREADLVMDVRFLKNPHWDKDLKPKTGLDEDVGNYIREDENYEDFIENFQKLLEPLLPRYKNEGKSYLTIGIGCTGGQHRSVFVTEVLSAWLKDQGYNTHIDHRDIPV